VGENFSTVKYSYATGNVSGTGMGGSASSGNTVGGLIGENYGTVAYSYATGSVSGGTGSTVNSGNDLGGLVGCNSGGSVAYSYATGNVSLGQWSGGLAGYNGNPYNNSVGTITDSYATGNITPGGTSGGLVGVNTSGSTITNGYWDTDTSGTTTGVGTGTSTGVTGLTTVQMGTQSSFSGWSFNSFSSGAFQNSNPWFMGYVTTGGTSIAAPIFVGDLGALTATANSASMVYDANTYTGSGHSFASTETVTMGAGTGNVGSVSFSGPAATATNVGAYTVIPALTLSAPTIQTQVGSVRYVNGVLTINPALLTASVSANKVYDGTDSASLSGSNTTFSGFVTGQGATVNSGTTGTYSQSNVGNALAITGGPLTTSNVTANSGTSLSNYTLPTTDNGTGNITPANLSATGTQVYNGTTGFSGSNLKVNGVDGQTFSASGTGTLGNSGNVQTNQNLASVSGLTLSGNGGALASNYNPLSTPQTSVSVTPAPLTLSTTASKTYDGTPSLSLTASNSIFSGLIGSQTASLSGRVTGTLNSPSIGYDLGGTISLSTGDVKGGNGFRTSNYFLPPTFLGGTITSSGLPTKEPLYTLYYAPGTSIEGVFGEMVRKDLDLQQWSIRNRIVSGPGEVTSSLFPGMGDILHIAGTGVNMEGLNGEGGILLEGNPIGR